MKSGRNLPFFHRNLLPPSSGQKISPTRRHIPGVSYLHDDRCDSFRSHKWGLDIGKFSGSASHDDPDPNITDIIFSQINPFRRGRQFSVKGIWRRSNGRKPPTLEAKQETNQQQCNSCHGLVAGYLPQLRALFRSELPNLSLTYNSPS